MTNRTFVLVDGENLVFRFQSMLKTGREKKDDQRLVYLPDVCLWHPDIPLLGSVVREVIRASYYTTVVGDEEKQNSVRADLARIGYQFYPEKKRLESGSLCPHVFKKAKSSQKTKSVDISLTIDALRHTYNDSMDILYLISGDGDYVPLVQEVMRQGKKVIVGALSDGLNPELRRIPDTFADLDYMFLK